MVLKSTGYGVCDWFVLVETRLVCSPMIRNPFQKIRRRLTAHCNIDPLHGRSDICNLSVVLRKSLIQAFLHYNCCPNCKHRHSYAFAWMWIASWGADSLLECIHRKKSIKYRFNIYSRCPYTVPAVMCHPEILQSDFSATILCWSGAPSSNPKFLCIWNAKVFFTNFIHS